MKITTLIENSIGHNKNLFNEHGLSIFIESDDCNILFDTGKTGNFVQNARDLNVNLLKTNCLVLSHAHYDHCGGVKKYINDFNTKPLLCISEHFFNNMNKYRHCQRSENLDFSSDTKEYKYIGIDFDEQYIKNKNLHIKYINEGMTKLSSRICIFTNFERNNKFEKLNPNMMIKRDNNYVVDTFKDEIVLTIDTSKGLLVLLGCSHPGVMNILNTIIKRTDKKIYGVLGGTHLIEADTNRINETINYFKDLNIKLIGVSHCTGEKAVDLLKQSCDNFFINCTGTILEI